MKVNCGIYRQHFYTLYIDIDYMTNIYSYKTAQNSNANTSRPC